MLVRDGILEEDIASSDLQMVQLLLRISPRLVSAVSAPIFAVKAEFFKSSLLWLKSSVSSFRKFGIGILDTECEDWSYDPSGHPP